MKRVKVEVGFSIGLSIRWFVSHNITITMPLFTITIELGRASGFKLSLGRLVFQEMWKTKRTQLTRSYGWKLHHPDDQFQG